MGLLRTSLLVVLSCAVMSVQAADQIKFGKGWLTYRPGLSAIVKIPVITVLMVSILMNSGWITVVVLEEMVRGIATTIVFMIGNA